MFKLLSALMILLLSGTVFASSVKGKVNTIIVRESDGLIYVTITGDRTEKPVCATKSYMVIKNETSVAGRQQLAMLLMAKATDKIVTVVGRDSCTRWNDGEDINYIMME